VGQFLGRLRRGLHVAVLCLASAAAGAGSLGDARAPSAADQLQTLTAAYQPDELIWMDIEVDTHRRLAAMERLARVIGR